MESIPHYCEQSGKFAGRTCFSSGLFRDAVAVAIKRVEGVVALRSDIAFTLRALIRRGTRKGLRIRPIGYSIVIIEACIVVAHGYAAADIAYRVQEAALQVAQSQGLSDKKIKRVDVKISNVAQLPTTEEQL